MIKITSNSGVSVSVSAGGKISPLLKNMIPGDSVQAEIVRSEGNRAILNIGGKLITAEFTNGIPAEKILELVLSEKNPDQIRFILKGRSPAEKISELFSSFSILNEDEMKNISYQNFARFLKSGRSDLISINLFLLGILKERGKRGGIVELFNRLLKQGVPSQMLADLGILLYGRDSNVFYLAYSIMSGIAGRKSFTAEENLKGFGKEIDRLFDLIGDDERAFSLIADFLNGNEEENCLYGEIPFPEEEGFSFAEYILKGETVFLKFELSETGEISVFIRLSGDSININFFSGREDVLELMKDNGDLLGEMLERNGVKKSAIGYFNSKKIVDKFELWSLEFYTKGSFSVKI